jgi:hypothetical protein
VATGAGTLECPPASLKVGNAFSYSATGAGDLAAEEDIPVGYDLIVGFRCSR